MARCYDALWCLKYKLFGGTQVPLSCLYSHAFQMEVLKCSARREHPLASLHLKGAESLSRLMSSGTRQKTEPENLSENKGASKRDTMRLQKPTPAVSCARASRPRVRRCIPACVQGGSSAQQPLRPAGQRSVRTRFAPDKVPEVVTPTGVRRAPVTFQSEFLVG